MPTEFKIIPSRGIVYVSHIGFVTTEGCLASVKSYTAHPDARPGQTQLINYAGATGYEKNWARFMELQAKISDLLPKDAPPLLLIQYAPVGHTIAQEMAAMVCKTWDDIPNVVPRIVETEAAALQMVGIPETRFADLLALA